MADDPPPRIPPPITDASRPFWTGGARGELLILRCARCRRWAHPPTSSTASCPACAGELAPEPVSGAGTILTFTVNRHPFNPSVPVPYVIAIVELAEQEGLRFTTNIVGCPVDDVAIGMRVQVAFEPAGEAWVPVFAPAPAG